MNNKLTNFIVFVTGVAIGSVATWKFVKTKYERIAQEEIDSVKAVFSIKKDSTPKKFEPKNFTPEESKTYENMVEDYGYGKNETDNDKEGEPDTDGPYVVSPEDFGNNGYEIQSLTYYADDTLADEFDEVVYDIEGTVGEDFASHFGEYEEDSVFIRNDKLEIDFEILRDLRNFSDVADNFPYGVNNIDE